jgi:hypothetical protein
MASCKWMYGFNHKNTKKNTKNTETLWAPGALNSAIGFAEMDDQSPKRVMEA